MLFNSYQFLMLYLPITVLGFFLAGRFSKMLAANWLAACSIFFYAWWDHRYIALLTASICLNYLAGRKITQHAGTPWGRRILSYSIGTNLLILGYYKYADFFISSSNTILGTEWEMLQVILPIGISFFTFTQIAFLVDAYMGKVREYRFNHYVLFVTYFPHLIAGPVLHHKEMMPQFDDARNYRPQAINFAIGLSIFAIGLAKKVLIADNLASYANPVFDPELESPSLLMAWGGALAYTFQLYFDFSGYSDMAIGLSIIFGVHLPINFNSPYKANNISEFWRRWHMTLSRFLRDYLYIPLGGNRLGIFRHLLNLMITMVLGGLWHGAGWNFVIWGTLHGSYLVVHHFWKTYGSSALQHHRSALRKACAHILTFTCVVFAWVYFRAPDLSTAHQIIIGMLGGNGIHIPEAIFSRLGPLHSIMAELGIKTYLGGGAFFLETWGWILLGGLIAFLAPNSQEIMASIEHAIRPPSGISPHLYRQPKHVFAIATGILLALGVLSLSRPTEFLYFQF